MGRHFGRIVAWEKPPAGKVWRAFFDDGHKVYLHEEDVAAIFEISAQRLPSQPLLVETTWLGRVRQWTPQAVTPSHEVPTHYPMGLTADDWDTMWMAPMWVLAAVGAVDGTLAPEEFAGLLRHVTNADASDSAIGRAVFRELAVNYDECQARFLADPRAAHEGLSRAGEILDTLEDEAAFSFRAQLMSLARDIAAARGGISNEEKTAVLQVAALIRLTGGEH